LCGVFVAIRHPENINGLSQTPLESWLFLPVAAGAIRVESMIKNA